MSAAIRRRAPEAQPEPVDPVYTTFDQVAARIPHVNSASTVEEYAALRRDPLRIRYRCRRPWIQESVLAAWLARKFGTREEKAALPKIRGREAICKAFGRDWRTVLRYAAISFDPLPLEGSGAGSWIYRSALIDWVNAHDVPRAVHVSGWTWKGGPTTRDDVCPPMPKKS